MTAQYYKLPWPEPLVPEGEPHWFYYEGVDGCVLRLVHEMEQGGLKRNSVERENAMGPTCVSLVHCDYSEVIDGAKYELISYDEFEEVYNAASDYS